MFCRSRCYLCGKLWVFMTKFISVCVLGMDYLEEMWEGGSTLAILDSAQTHAVRRTSGQYSLVFSSQNTKRHGPCAVCLTGVWWDKCTLCQLGRLAEGPSEDRWSNWGQQTRLSSEGKVCHPTLFASDSSAKSHADRRCAVCTLKYLLTAETGTAGHSSAPWGQ